jgi:Xaa-Pro aminopeptidase
MHAQSYQSISRYTDAEEARMVWEDRVIEAYDLAMEQAEQAVRARLAQEFDGDIPGEVDAVISEELAQRRLNRIALARLPEVAL